MSLAIIGLIVLFGLFLIFVEFLIIPGITIAGVGGGFLMIGGVIGAYYYHGNEAGNYMLLGTIVANIISFYFLFKKKTWNKMGLEAEIDSRVNTLEMELNIGDIGESVSRLVPTGKARFKDKICEVQSINGLIDPRTEIEITSINSNKIFVKIK